MCNLSIESIRIEGNRIDVLFETSNLAAKFFKNNHFWLEYSEPISDVPEGIAVIPFICNILPVVWIANIEVNLPELDKTFFESIEDIKKSYMKMYPNIDFRGKVVPQRIIDYSNTVLQNDGAALFFSGGVDAFASLIEHIDENPDLLIIWGADVQLEDVKGWVNVKTHISNTAKTFDLKAIEIKSNFRMFLDLSGFGILQSEWNYNYWGYLHHGIGIIGHAAPYVYLKGYSVTYIASSFSPDTRKKDSYAWASDPTIDNKVNFSNARTYHDMEEYTRQGKINKIVDFSNKSHKMIQLRVCWESIGGENCSQCEKCYRTIMGIIAAGGNPNSFGFKVTKNTLSNIKRYIAYKAHFDWVKREFWQEIQSQISIGYIIPEYKEHINWITSYDFNEVNNSPIKKIRFFWERVNKKVKRTIKTLKYNGLF